MDRDYEYAEAIRAIQLPKSRPPVWPRIVQIVAAIGFLLAFGIIGNFDYADSIEREAQTKVLRAERAAEAAKLSHPIPYAFTAKDCLPSGRGCTQERFYVPASHKEVK